MILYLAMDATGTTVINVIGNGSTTSPAFEASGTSGWLNIGATAPAGSNFTGGSRALTGQTGLTALPTPVGATPTQLNSQILGVVLN
jgi:hypothetical protein